jgi:hypothetical protein
MKVQEVIGRGQMNGFNCHFLIELSHPYYITQDLGWTGATHLIAQGTGLK